MHEITPELAKILIGALLTGTATVIGAVVWLTTLVFRIGREHGRLEALADRIEHVAAMVEETKKIPIIETKLDQLAAFYAEERRRYAGQWTEVLEKVAKLWDRSEHRRESQGQYGE
jgi:hypothetical protein